MGDAEQQACRVKKPRGSPMYFNLGHFWAAFRLMPMANVSLPLEESLKATNHTCVQISAHDSSVHSCQLQGGWSGG